MFKYNNTNIINGGLVLNKVDEVRVSLDKNLYKIIEDYKNHEDISSMKRAIDILIRAGFENKQDELPESIISKLHSEERVKVRKKKITKESGKMIQSIGLPSNIMENVARTKNCEVGNDEDMRSILLANLRFLKSHGEARKSDFMNNVFPKFEENLSKEKYWEMTKHGLKQSSDLIEEIKRPSTGNKRYKWKGSEFMMENLGGSSKTWSTS